MKQIFKILITVMMLQSCQSEKKIDNIIVREDRSYEYDLSKGEGIINNTDRSVYKKFKFHKISEAKIQHISELYHEKKLDTIANGKFIFDNGIEINPPKLNTIKIIFNDKTSTEIKFCDNRLPNAAERMPYYTKEFFKEITDITYNVRDSLKLISPVVYR